VPVKIAEAKAPLESHIKQLQDSAFQSKAEHEKQISTLQQQLKRSSSCTEQAG